MRCFFPEAHLLLLENAWYLAVRGLFDFVGEFPHTHTHTHTHTLTHSLTHSLTHTHVQGAVNPDRVRRAELQRGRFARVNTALVVWIMKRTRSHSLTWKKEEKEKGGGGKKKKK